MIEFESSDPTAKLDGHAILTEIGLIPQILALKEAGAVEFLWQREADVEFRYNLRSSFLGYPVPPLLAAGVTMVSGPIPYARSDPFGRATQLQFMKTCHHERFLELQKACGAYQGDHLNESQLYDAFHIWCAEAGARVSFSHNRPSPYSHNQRASSISSACKCRYSL